ncbi:MAG: cytochrome c peroxidase [Thermodesulfobacteriota bacterium]
MNIKYKIFSNQTILGLLLLTLFTVPLRAHIIKEEAWHPVTAAYLRGVFYANLKPVDWDLIESEYGTVKEPGYKINSVYEALIPLIEFSGEDHSLIIKEAIKKNDREAFYIATTRAMSQLVRYHVNEAKKSLNQPAIATEEIQNAKRIYRAFEDFIEQVDQQTYDNMGRAWLDMSSSTGSSGIFGIAKKDPDLIRFEASQKYVEDFLIKNYEIDSISTRGMIVPIPVILNPETTTVSVNPWLPPGSDLNNQDPLPRLVLNFEERGLDEKDLFLVAYGDMIFDSPEIFGEPARSLGIACSTCHNRSDINKRFVIPGVSKSRGSADVDGHFFNPLFNDHRSDSLDIPSLRGLRFTAPYGRDGRFTSLRDFTRNVIVNEFAGKEPTPLMLDALITYMLEFDWLPANYLNPDGTLKNDVPQEAKRGEEIFNKPFAKMGGRACSSCHIPSSNFMDGLRHDIGSGNPASPGARDSFFDTPTLINIKYTDPYFHDGSLESLSDVVEWFNNQYGLELTKAQRSDLTAYLDAVGTGEEPYEIFDEENTIFLLDWGELSTFITTLNTLIPAKDKFHSVLLLKTVSSDMRLDAAGLQDLSQAPMVYELADKLDEILTAVDADDWPKAAILWSEYQQMEEEYGPKLK